MHALTPLRWTGGQTVPPGFIAGAETCGISGEPRSRGEIDRHVRCRPPSFWQLRCGAKPIRAACSRIRRVVLRQGFLPGRADPDPSGSSRMSAPCGLVGARKVLAESSVPFWSLQVPALFSSRFAHVETWGVKCINQSCQLSRSWTITPSSLMFSMLCAMLLATSSVITASASMHSSREMTWSNRTNSRSLQRSS